MKKGTIYVTNEIVVPISYSKIKVYDSGTNISFFDGDGNVIASFSSYLGFVQNEEEKPVMVTVSDIVQQGSDKVYTFDRNI